MKGKKKKIFRILAILTISGLLIGGGIIIYMFNMPHRNVQNSKTDFTLTTSQIVNEYLADAQVANEKYLAEDGDSKILEITGTINTISENFDKQKVVFLKEENDKAGVDATFLDEAGEHLKGLKTGDKITIKGVIRSGASYDEDLEMYENVILDKSDIIK